MPGEQSWLISQHFGYTEKNSLLDENDAEKGLSNLDCLEANAAVTNKVS